MNITFNRMTDKRFRKDLQIKEGEFGKIMVLLSLGALLLAAGRSSGGALKAPPGMYKDLNNEILGDAIIVRSKQLFIDDYIIEKLDGAEKILNQPTKHSGNPILGAKERLNLYGSVLYDKEEKVFKMWYDIWHEDTKTASLCYATSADGVSWTKPIVNKKDNNNVLSIPKEWGFVGGPGVIKDTLDPDPKRRYKMLYVVKPGGLAKFLAVDSAYSPDGIHWTEEPSNPIITFSDTQPSPYWDAGYGRYVVYLRYGPPNVRAVARIESEDFIHWSPKVTVLPQLKHKLDKPRSTTLYGMRIMPYQGDVNIGLLTAYHGETISKIPEEKELWMDKGDVQLTFSRNGLTWNRVGKNGVITPERYEKETDWMKASEEAAFIPWGRHKVDWDWARYIRFRGPWW
jgi:hypothetical protein